MVKTWIIEKVREEREDDTYQFLLDSAINTRQDGEIFPAIQILKNIVRNYPDDSPLSLSS